jgi:hypothetical protein
MDIRETLNVKIESPFWDEAYEKALSEKGTPEWLTPEFINMLNEDYGVLQRTYDVVISALPKVLAVRELCLLAKTVYHILDKRLPYSKSFKSLELPSVPDTDENALGDRCVLVFPVLMHVHKTWCELFGEEDRDLCTVDMCHPNDLGFYRIAKTVMPIIKKCLEK